MRVLITGIAGFLGSSLAKWLLDHISDVELCGVDDFSCGYVENIPVGIKWYRISLGRGDQSLARVFSTFAPEYVFHLAAYAAECLSPFVRRYNYLNNICGTAEVINNCISVGGVKRLVFTSSIAAYGAGEVPFRENELCRPIDPYGVAKLACEMDLQIAGEQHGLDWCVLRPHNIYGPPQSLWQEYRNVFGVWASRHLRELPLQIYGDGMQRRAFSWIGDICPAMWQAAVAPEASKQIINLGGAQPISILQAAEAMIEVIGNGSIEYVDKRHEVKYSFATVSKSIDLLAYSETMYLPRGLYAYWEWARRVWDQFPNRRNEVLTPRLELRRGLYDFWQGAY